MLSTDGYRRDPCVTIRANLAIELPLIFFDSITLLTYHLKPFDTSFCSLFVLNPCRLYSATKEISSKANKFI